MEATPTAITFYKDIATVLISLLALGLTIWNGYLSRKHNKISQRPLIASNTYLASNTISYEIRNIGNGTAVIEEQLFFINGKGVNHDSFLNDMKSYLSDFVGTDSTYEYAHLNDEFSSVGVNEKEYLFKITSNIDITIEKQKKILNRYATKIRYKSLYEDKFLYTSKSLLQPKKYDLTKSNQNSLT
jgi:hypothetical protein